MLVFLSRDHRYWIAKGERWEFFYLTLAGNEVVKRVDEIAGKVGPVVALAADSPTLWRAAQTCADALEHKIQSPYHGSALAYGILMEVLDENMNQAQRPTPPLPAVRTLFADVEEFCGQNLARPIGVEDMARVANMSRFHFTRLFRRAWGVSPGRYLDLRRLERALGLVRAGGDTVEQIAERCGFSDSSYFCKVFRRNFGVTPGRLRAGSQSPGSPALPIVNSLPDCSLVFEPYGGICAGDNVQTGSGS